MTRITYKKLGDFISIAVWKTYEQFFLFSKKPTFKNTCKSIYNNNDHNKNNNDNNIKNNDNNKSSSNAIAIAVMIVIIILITI